LRCEVAAQLANLEKVPEFNTPRNLDISRDGHSACRHDNSIALRNIVSSAGNAELFQPASERVGVQPQNPSRAPRTVNDPARLL
jgi:hypothetical protein